MKLSFAFISCFLIFGSSLWSKAEGAKPNVLFIAIDDLNDWVGFMGGGVAGGGAAGVASSAASKAAERVMEDD